MDTGLVESNARFSFHLDGAEQIEAALLSDIIRNLAELSKIAASSEDPEAYIKMNVCAFRDGSFQIDFSTVCTIQQTLLTDIGKITVFAGTVIGVVKGFLEVKKLLKGESPKNIKPLAHDKIEVENNSGQTIIVPKSSGAIINNVKIDQLTINIAAAVQEHNPKGGFSLSSEGESSQFNADDVKSIRKPIPYTEEVNCKRYRCEVVLLLNKVDFIGRSRWTFKYDNKQIQATIEDEDFLETIHKGLEVKVGDYINAVMEIYVDLDPLGLPQEDTARYSIVKVIGSINHNYTQLEI